jgi:predicted RNA-binding Zn ribbon-like protein
MSQSAAVGRFGLEPAPGGLRLVQDLVNTALSARQGDSEQDELADLSAATAWLGQALAEWSAATGRPLPDISLRQRDLGALRTLREQLRQSLRASAEHVDPVPHAQSDGEVDSDVRLTLRADGQVDYRPLTPGLAGLISVEMLLAGATGAVSRLKSCAAPACGACFYDGSPNRARVWHNTKMCGNVPNLRASRARRKA